MKKLLSAVALLLSLSLFLGSCGDSAADAPTASGSEAQAATIDDLQIRDSETIYKDDDEDSVVTMYLTVSQGNAAENTNHTWQDVNDHSVYYYEEQGLERYAVEGILQVGDENGPIQGMFGYGEFAPNCTVTIRGKTSTRSPQKSYRIEINKNEGYWREQRVINLNKHVYDSVRFRNKLSYDLLKTIPGAFSCRTQFVHLYVKDLTEGNTAAAFQDYGLYTQVEQINKAYLRNHGLDENGQLYKATMFEFMRYEDAIKLSSDPSYDLTAFEQILEVKGNDDHTKLINMLDDLNNYAIPIETTFEKYFDEENYFTWLAFQILTGNIDTINQNFFLYSFQNGQKFYFISWDNDGAWSYEEDILYRGRPSGYYYMQGVSNYWGSILHQRVLKSDTYRQMLDDKINELRASITAQRVAGMVETYSAIVIPYLTSLPDSMYATRSMAEVEQILPAISREMDHRYEAYQTSLQSPMPFYLGEPEPADGGLSFGWDSSYDFDGEKITYKFELARDYLFQDTVSVQDGLVIPQAFTEELPEGEYFYRVTATNESGYTQTAMEAYDALDETRHYGVVNFYVQADGSILWDV